MEQFDYLAIIMPSVLQINLTHNSYMFLLPIILLNWGTEFSAVRGYKCAKQFQMPCRERAQIAAAYKDELMCFVSF